MEAVEPKHYKACALCGEVSYSKSSYYRHKCDKPKKGQFKCLEIECQYVAKTFRCFALHMKNVHSTDVNQEKVLKFQSYSDFTIWLHKFQEDTNAEFQLRQSKNLKDKETKYFYCNRSGTYQEKQNRSRKPKKGGSKKIGHNCTARLKVEITQGLVTAYVNSFHYGHENDLRHVRLNKQTKEELAQSLSNGMSTSQVLRNIFTASTSTDLKRKHLITKEDIDNVKLALKKKSLNSREEIENIKLACKVNHNRKLAANITSVDMLVEENIVNILFYKKQDVVQLSHPSLVESNLDKEDFALGIMTPFQKEMLKRYGHKIVLCTTCDAPYRNLGCNFLLVSVMVIDEHRNCIPIAWLMSNNNDSTILKLFFEYIQESVGQLFYTKIFMSERAPQYFESWQEVFPGNTQNLLCHWHVYENWRKELDKIKNKETADDLFQQLSLLLNEPEKLIFQITLETFQNEVFSNEDTEIFGHYFSTEWVPIVEQWAVCYRVECGIYTNMYVEAYLKKIKCFFHAKKERGVDKCFTLLLDYITDVARQKLINQEKGLSTDKVDENNRTDLINEELGTDTIDENSRTNTMDEEPSTVTIDKEHRADRMEEDKRSLKKLLVQKMKRCCEALENVEDFSRLQEIEKRFSSVEEIMEEQMSDPSSSQRQCMASTLPEVKYITYEIVMADGVPLSL